MAATTRPFKRLICLPIIPNSDREYRLRFPYQVDNITLVDYQFQGIDAGELGNTMILRIGGTLVQNEFFTFTDRTDTPNTATIEFPTAADAIPIPVRSTPVNFMDVSRPVPLTEGKRVICPETTIKPKLFTSNGITEATFSAGRIYLEITQTWDQYQLTQPNLRASRLAQ